MASDPRLTTHDPDLDPPRAAPRRPSGPVLMPQETMRVVVNPFLAAASFTFGLWALLSSVRFQDAIPVVLLAMVATIGAPLWLHYHCLDCGATGHFFRWRRHQCDRVLVRRLNGQVRRLRGPNPVAQMVLWFYFLLAAWLLAAAVSRPHPWPP